MRHPTEGVLRRLLDEPAAIPDADREHVVGCEECLGELAAIRVDAELVHAAMTEPVGGIDVDAAWERQSATPSATQPAPTVSPARPARFRAAARRPAVAGVAVALVLAGAGAAAAGGWLPIFRTEQIAPVPLSASDLNAVPDLASYGDLVVTGDPDVHPVADAEAAAAQTGIDVPEVTALPLGVSGAPEYQVGGEVSATFTFSADRAARTAAEAGEALPSPPPGLDGTQVRLVAGPGVAVVWSQESGVPALIVGRAVAPTAFSSTGISFETLRDYLLSLPGMPEEVAAPLRTFNADGSTLPLPVPAERFTTAPAEVGGAEATVVESRDRTMAAVLWVDDGVVTVVAGSLDAGEVLSVARGLR